MLVKQEEERKNPIVVVMGSFKSGFHLIQAHGAKLQNVKVNILVFIL